MDKRQGNDEAWIARACITCSDKRDTNATDKYGYTPLHRACNYAKFDVVKLLLDSGAQPSLYHKDYMGCIPIDYAVTGGRFDFCLFYTFPSPRDRPKS